MARSRISVEYWFDVFSFIAPFSQRLEPPRNPGRFRDIITREGEPHLYRSILGQRLFVEDEKVTWSPGSLIENSNESGWWQPVMPKLEQCLLFGVNDVLDSRGWGGGRVAEDGEYIHALWRPYTCCEIKDGALIVIDFMPYPSPIVTN
ncbi:TraU family protein [Methylomonas methanica]|uniref:TraU family protein n=1 Tax=Methylomonas methanica TaxID=421 RepID=UPI001EE63C6D|nr:TraU family protein [Methylomonas methanica]